MIGLEAIDMSTQRFLQSENNAIQGPEIMNYLFYVSRQQGSQESLHNTIMYTCKCIFQTLTFTF
jgi:hypothetical protein